MTVCYDPGRKGSDAARAPRAGGAELSVHRRVAIVLLLAIPCAGAADFQAGQEAYDRGDYATALGEWRPLAEGGDAAAQYQLGVMYDDGEGVLEDDREAARWYRRAAEQGYVAAQLALGAIHAAGRGVAEDRVQAWVWYDLAAARGNEAAEEGRARVERGMTPAEIDEARKLRGTLGGPPPADWEKQGGAPVPPPEMVLITGGCFRMGSPESEAGRAGNESHLPAQPTRPAWDRR